MNLEITGAIGQRFGDLTASRLISAPLTVWVGGTGANFATAAVPRFAKVRLLGAVGADRPGAMIESSLRALGIDARLYRCPERPTGTVVTLREGGADGGARLMVASPLSANDSLSRAKLEQNADCLDDVHLLVVDGYGLLHEPRRTAVLAAMARARAAGAQVMLDLVPHHLDQLISRQELHVWLTHVSIIVTEVVTVRALLNLQPSKESANIHDATETAKHLERNFPGRAFLLRFGAHNIDESLVWRSSQKVHRYTGFTQTAVAHGFGDRLTVEEVSRYFTDCWLRHSCEP
ncbi:carbohydrate kinase family protein [Streptomyces sp. NPDC088747]|uniref:carbohydrate kinase family protein n=1 Tax=Streptomyces sp. NPDC088747 TaxID=3365886 RepID=UPI0038123031